LISPYGSGNAAWSTAARGDRRPLRLDPAPPLGDTPILGRTGRTATIYSNFHAKTRHQGGGCV